MFAINDKSSFDGLLTWVDQVKKTCENILLIIVGTKKDRNYERQISQQDGNIFAEKCKGHYFEISSMENIGINELINFIVIKLISIKEQNELKLK
jgi:GTPase SAR1 family protein